MDDFDDLPPPPPPPPRPDGSVGQQQPAAPVPAAAEAEPEPPAPEEEAPLPPAPVAPVEDPDEQPPPPAAPASPEVAPVPAPVAAPAPAPAPAAVAASSEPASRSSSSAAAPHKPPPPVASVLTAHPPARSAAEQKRYDALNPPAKVEEKVLTAPPRRLLLEGVLGKKSPGMFGGWQDRYFLLYSDKFEYYKIDAKQREDAKTGKIQPQGIVPLYAVKLVTNLAAVKGKATRFDVLVGDTAQGRTFELQTQTPYECENWVANLKDAMAELEKYGGAMMTSAVAGSGGPSGGAGGPRGSVKDPKFWKDTKQIEETLSAPIPVPVVSSAHKAAQEKEREEQAAAAAAATAAPSSAAATPAASATRAASPGRKGESEETKAARAALIAQDKKKQDAAARSSIITVSSASAAPASKASAKVAAAPSELPVKLSLVKIVSKGPLGSVFLTKDRSSAAEASAFYLMHVVRRHASSATNAATDNEMNRAQIMFAKMARLSCPYLPQALYTGSTLDAVFQVYAPASRVQDSLLSYLAQHRRLPEAVVKHIGAQLVVLLGYLHDGPAAAAAADSFVARTLCPDNLSFDGLGRILYVDLCLALKKSASADDGLIPEYLTPELAAGRAEDRGADAWRLGVLLYELSVGIPPFRAAAQARGSVVDPLTARKQKKEEIAAKLAAYADPAELKFPPFVSPGFHALIRALLHPQSASRLGGSASDSAAMRAHAYWSDMDWSALSRGESLAAASDEVKAWIQEKVIAVVPNAAAIAAANPNASADQLKHLCMQPPPFYTAPASASSGAPLTVYALPNNLTASFGFCDGVDTELRAFKSLAAAAASSSASSDSAPVAPMGPAFSPVDLGRTTPPPALPANAADDDDDDEDDDDDDDAQADGADAAAADSAAASSSSDKDKKASKSLIRGLVSKKKLRYQQDGFDLDLSYITPRIIAMGFPSEGVEATYRNPMVDVQRFFSEKHAGRFRIYNLCSERKYPHSKFCTPEADDAVRDIPFNDHNAPAFELLMMFCVDAHKFLAEHEHNVVAVHCKAGKGRTGTIIAAFLLYEQRCHTADEALRFFGAKRTKNGAGVTIPSQRRYVAYFAEWLHRHRLAAGGFSADIPLSPAAVTLRLKHIRFHTVPNFDRGGGCDPYAKIKGPPPEEAVLYDLKKELRARGLKVQNVHDKAVKYIDFPIPDGDSARAERGCLLRGDFKLCFFDEDKVGSDDPMFHCWLNTAFVGDSLHVVLTKAECDKAVKDKKCDKFDRDFKVELWFTLPVDRVADGSGEADGFIVPVSLGCSTPAQPAGAAEAEMLPSNVAPVDDDEDEDDDDDDDAQADGADAAAADSAAASSSSDKDKKASKSLIRGLVSKKKLRYQQDGFDLDLSYITPRIIAMGFPSEGVEATYRNPMPVVQKFFQSKHAGRYRVYNLCSERTYEHEKFEDNVLHVPFNDHNAPSFDLFLMFCRDAHKFLSANEENVIAVHCKAGKGRTGTMIAALLLFESHSTDALEALRFFGNARTKNGAGVTIPSQRRYVSYFASYLSRFRSALGLKANIDAAPAPVPLRLVSVTIHTIPNFDIGGGCDPYFKVKGPPPAETTLYDYRVALKSFGQKLASHKDKSKPVMELAVPGTGTRYSSGPCDPTQGCIIAGDVKFCFLDQDTIGSDDPMFHCWINTAFVDPHSLRVTLTKAECDKAVKDKKCEKFDREFKVEFQFVRVEQ